MIAPAFLIKILGCATVGAFLTIGVPVIVANENERKAEEARHLVEATKVEAVQKRQADIDKPATLLQFFTNLTSVLSSESKTESVIKAGETFSDAAFTSWSPKDETEKTAIATNFSSIIKHMPNAFFNKLKDKNLTAATGVCHIQTSGTTVSQQTNQSLYIPFLKSEITSDLKLPFGGVAGSSLNLVVVQAKGQSMETHWGDFLKTDKANFKTELKAIAAGTQVPAARVPDGTATTSETTQKEKAIATDLLFLQTLYEDAIDRLTKELGNPVTSQTGSVRIWAPMACS